MSQWTERIKTHPIWNELNLLDPAIDQAAAREGNDITVIDGLERLRAVLGFCGKRLASADTFLVEPRPLTALNTALTNARTEIETFITDGIAAHIANANVKADELLAALPAILAPNSSDELTVISESVSSYRTALEKHLQEALAMQLKLNAASDANGIKLADLEKTLTTEQQRLATLVSDYQTQFSTAQDKRASEFAVAQADQQTKNAALMSENQTQFSAAQDARTSGHAEAQRDNQEKFTALIADYTQKLKEQNDDFTDQHQTAAETHQANLVTLKTDYEQSAKAILDQINVYKNQVEKLVGVIGNLGVTSGYLRVANHARYMLYLWQFLTIFALGCLIVVAYVMAFHPASPQAASQATSPTAPDSVFYQGLATRIFLSITFGIFAAYAAKQASKFLGIEQRNRKLALELEALGPYIAPLPVEMQHKFRTDFGERSFGIPDNDSSKPSEGDPVSVLDILKSKEAGEVISSILKAGKSAEGK